MDDAPQPPGARRGVWIYLVLLLTFAIHAPSLANDFAWDDRWAAMGHHGAVEHPLVAELRPLSEYFEHHYWPHRTPVSETFRPATTLSFALRHAAFGDNSLPAHWANVVLHVLATALTYVLLVRLAVPWSAACVGMLVFGVHAVHSEAVANVVGRAELLGFVGGAAATLLLDSARRRGVVGRTVLGVGSAACAFLAFCAKESALAWVAFAPLWWAVARRRRGEPWLGSPAGTLLGVAALVIPAAAYWWLRQRMLGGLPGTVDASIGYLENPLLDVPSFVRVCTGTLLWGYGLLLTLLPFSLSADYGPCQLPVVDGANGWELVAGGAGLAIVAVGAGGLVALRRAPVVFLAAAAFLGFSFIVTNLARPVFMMFAERTYYAPSLGLSLLVAVLAERLGRRPLLVLLLGAWIGASCVVTVDRCGVWRDDDTLVLHEVAAQPRSVRFNLCAGDLWRGRGDTQAARRYFERATELDPQCVDAWLEVARVRLDQGDLDGAAAALSRSRSARPREVQARLVEIEAVAAQLAAQRTAG
ncbi:MAG: tetratricopeptide repeat protein [Planctomycetota bacterium]